MTFVREGESLKAVAERFNTTVTALAAVNALANPDALAEGEALLVPVGVPHSLVRWRTAVRARSPDPRDGELPAKSRH